MSHDSAIRARPGAILLGMLVAGLAPHPGSARAAPTDEVFAIRRTPAAIVALSGSRKLFEYRLGDVEFKPYVKSLATPKGVNVLLDAPADHLHHHGLMFAIGVDGVDFWSELHAEAPGAQREHPAELLSDVREGVSEAGLTQRLDWVDLRGEKKPLLTEERTVSASDPAGRGVTLLTWTSRLQPPKGTEEAQLWGRHYFGLGLRFVRSMDTTGSFRSSSGREGRVVRGDERLAPATWCAYTAEADGHPVTVAMFDDPENPRHPATWFTMTQPFAYLSATLNLDAEPLTLRANEPLRLRYGVALWDGHIDPAAIEKLYREWASR